jgi:acyl-CoA thioesterase YciA
MNSYHPEDLKDEICEYGDEPIIRVVMMPKHTNAMGTIFGGVVLSHLDLAASEEARKSVEGPVVTKVLREVDFIAPVNVGDWISCYTRTDRIGETSVTVSVLVVAQRGHAREEICKVTQAEAVFVAVDENGKPTQIS